MRKVKLLVGPLLIGNRHYEKGDVVEADPRKAAELVAAGHASHAAATAKVGPAPELDTDDQLEPGIPRVPFEPAQPDPVVLLVRETPGVVVGKVIDRPTAEAEADADAAADGATVEEAPEGIARPEPDLGDAVAAHADGDGDQAEADGPTNRGKVRGRARKDS